MGRGQLSRGLEGGERAPAVREGLGTVDDLTVEADDQTVDRFFTVTGDDIAFETGQAPPIPRPWLGMPRMAITVNLNFVKDPDTGEWTPQHPFEGGGGGGISWTFDFVVRNTDTSDITVSAAGTLQAVENNTASQITVVLPSGPADGDTVMVVNSINSGSQLAVSAPSPDEIQGFDFDPNLAVGAGTRFWYDADNGQWWQDT